MRRWALHEARFNEQRVIRQTGDPKTITLAESAIELSERGDFSLSDDRVSQALSEIERTHKSPPA